MVEGTTPLGSVRYTNIGHEHGSTIGISDWILAEKRRIKAPSRRYPRSSPILSSTPEGSRDPISVRHLRTCTPQVTAEREEKYDPSVDVTTVADDVSEERQERDFRTWHDSTGLHWQHAALAYYKDGVVHLSSFDGTLLEIPEDKLARDDLTYLRSQDVYKKQRKVTFRLFS